MTEKAFDQLLKVQTSEPGVTTCLGDRPVAVGQISGQR